MEVERPVSEKYRNRAPHIASLKISAMDTAAVSLQCDFCNFEHCKAIECGVYPSYLRESNTLHLHQCIKTIQSHLQKWKVAAYDVNVEWKLILLRCRLFHVDAYTMLKDDMPGASVQLRVELDINKEMLSSTP